MTRPSTLTRTTPSKVRPTEIVIDHDEGGFFTREGRARVEHTTLRTAEVYAAKLAEIAYTQGAKKVTVLNVTRASARTVRLTKAQATKLAALAYSRPDAVHGWTERMAGMPLRNSAKPARKSAKNGGDRRYALHEVDARGRVRVASVDVTLPGESASEVFRGLKAGGFFPPRVTAGDFSVVVDGGTLDVHRKRDWAPIFKLYRKR